MMDACEADIVVEAPTPLLKLNILRNSACTQALYFILVSAKPNVHCRYKQGPMDIRSAEQGSAASHFVVPLTS